MKQTFGLRLGQHAVLTPQLHHAIKLMQLSAVELRQEVRQAIESNPMLELVEDEAEDAGEDAAADEASADEDDFPSDDGMEDALTGEEDGDEASISESLDAIPEELPVDVSWDDVYQGAPASTASNPAPEDAGFEERNTSASTLQDHLQWQLNLTPMSDRDRLIAAVIVDSIDANGMLADSLEALLGALDASLGIELADAEAVLKRVQHFDPPGVGARDLRECLLLQLDQLPADTPRREEALDVVQQHFPLLAKRDFATLSRRTKLPEDALADVMALIQTLNPRPGAAIGDNEAEYVEPDVIVRRNDGAWTVELNPRLAPRVRVHAGYACLVKRGDKSAENTYLKENLQDAKWFLNNLTYRNETLLKVAAEIVQRQRGFLEHGPEAMQPLVLADVATAVDRHESTVSRVTTRKYLETPRGVFELKYFFSSHVASADGGEVSSTAIRALIKKLISEETPRRPLSDSKIAAMLKDQHINVARRTVAKYRESLAIASSNERRRLV